MQLSIQNKLLVIATPSGYTYFSKSYEAHYITLQTLIGNILSDYVLLCHMGQCKEVNVQDFLQDK